MLSLLEQKGSCMISVEEIVELYKQRNEAQGPVLQQMRQVRSLANGDIIVPLNELDRNTKSSVANLLVQGLDQMSMRVASTMPVPYFPALKEGNDRSMKLARDRKRALLSIWDQNRMNQKMRRRARHLIAYASAPIFIKPNFDKRIPEWHLRNPLDTFPAPLNDPDNPVPDDCIFTYSRTYDWIAKNYGPIINGVLRTSTARPDTKFTILEYVCDYEVVTLCLGDERLRDPITGLPFPGADAVELGRVINRTNMPLVVIPQRITLDKPHGQFDGLLGMYYTRARLQALTEIAIERGIFPDEYLVARPGENPEIMQIADGKTGQLGMVKGGDIQQLQQNPGYKTDVALDRLERQERLEGSIPAEFGGESGTNIRTGRRGDSILSATVDFRVQESQELLATSMVEEDKIAIAMEKTYWGNSPKSFFIPGLKGGMADYTPNKLWETDFHYVSYSASGSDVNSLIVGLGQRLGTGLMSKETARESDPLIADPELERDRLVAEGIEAALMQSIQAQAADPNGPYQPDDLAFIAMQVQSNKMSLPEAIQAAQKRAQDRQAAQAPQGAPETMPGLAMPGMGAEQPAAPMGGGGPPSMESLLSNLQGPPAGASAMPGTPGSVLSLAGRLGG
jgi:hypothetical protein